MTLLLGVLLAAACTGLVWLGVLLAVARSRARKAAIAAERAATQARSSYDALTSRYQDLEAERRRLAMYENVANADDMARRIHERSRAEMLQAQRGAAQIVAEAKATEKELTAQGSTAIRVAHEEARRIVEQANAGARQIAGKAYDAVHNADRYERTARAMKNIIEGYGDAYLKPAASLLDDLAEEFAHKDAGKQLKLARANAAQMVKDGNAADCQYQEQGRRDMAIAFVLDAFNGKVDSILSRVKHDNFGKLEQEISDAFTIVNHNGTAFRNARITVYYLAARLTELKWAVVALELKKKEQEEQRLIREQLREEAKAQREYEKAIREAAKEEETIRKAMARAQQQIDKATAEQRAMYEAQLAELHERLVEAELKNQRAISMAQQTRRGHVYIISNVGSFGENIYKIGLTRRLEPLDRVKELGDASVPFEFDVHAIIWAEDAPALETQLHKHFLLHQVNKVNHRKEFFRAQLADIRQEIDALGIEAKWTMASEAQQYRETLAIERAIESDPVAKEQWLNRQLTLDPVEWAEDGELVGAGEE